MPEPIILNTAEKDRLLEEYAESNPSYKVDYLNSTSKDFNVEKTATVTLEKILSSTDSTLEEIIASTVDTYE